MGISLTGITFGGVSCRLGIFAGIVAGDLETSETDTLYTFLIRPLPYLLLPMTCFLMAGVLKECDFPCVGIWIIIILR